MTILLILCLLVLLFFFLLAPGRAGEEQKAPFLGVCFAHRGLHTPDKSVPENSAPAFRRAVEEGYGVELDVRLTADGQVVVFHDDTLDRICAVPGRVDAFSYDDLRAFSLCGTGESIPLFSDVLDILGRSTPVIVELKTGPRNRELCEKTCALLREKKPLACIESFDPLILAWFRRHAREFFRGQLATRKKDYRSDGWSGPVPFLLSNTLANFLGRPQFIAYHVGPRPWPVRLAAKLGAVNMGWVCRRPADEAGLEGIIFEFYAPAKKAEKSLDK